MRTNSVGAVFFGSEGPPEGRLHSEHVEEAMTDATEGDAARLTGALKGTAPVHDSRDTLERLDLTLPIGEDAFGDGEARPLRGQHGRDDDSVGLVEGEWFEHHGAHQADDRHRRPDSERQCE